MEISFSAQLRLTAGLQVIARNLLVCGTNLGRNALIGDST